MGNGANLLDGASDGNDGAARCTRKVHRRATLTKLKQQQPQRRQQQQQQQQHKERKDEYK